jgi:hypothetical protein
MERIEMKTPSIRQDRRTGQYVPTLDGKDRSPTSFDKDRAMEIARQLASMESLGLINKKPLDTSAAN